MAADLRRRMIEGDAGAAAVGLRWRLREGRAGNKVTEES